MREERNRDSALPNKHQLPTEKEVEGLKEPKVHKTLRQPKQSWKPMKLWDDLILKVMTEL